jgi:chromosome segregation ATPase
MSEPKKRQPGRPSLPDEEKRSRNLTFRSRGDLRDRLNDAATQSGRSISEEIEFRLEASFTKDERIEELKGRLDEMRQRLESSKVEYEKDRAELKEKAAKRREDIEKFRAEAAADLANAKAEMTKLQVEVEGDVKRLEGADALLEGLLGENKQKAQLLRLLAIELAKIPDEKFVIGDTSRIGEQLNAQLIKYSARTA